MTTIDDLGILVWNSRNRLLTKFSYRYIGNDYYDGPLEECIINVLGIDETDIFDIEKKQSMRTLYVRHQITCHKRMDELLDVLAVMLSLSISKRNRIPGWNHDI